MNKPKRNYRAAKLKSFLFFILLAVSFWMLTKFSKEQTATIDVKLVYDEIPNRTSLSNTNIDEISFDVLANGFEFLMYKLKRPGIIIPLNNYYKEGDTLVTIDQKELTRLINSQLNKSLTVKNLSVDELQVLLDMVIGKEIPVKANVDITYRNGFKKVDSVVLNPPQVLVIGPEEILKQIDTIFTKNEKFDDVHEDLSSELIVETPNLEDIKIETKKVDFTLKVAEYTQKELLLPIKVINVPQGKSIKIIPEKVKIGFNVSVANFNQISEEDFVIVCDYTSQTTSESFMLLEIEKQPRGVDHIEFGINKVNYFVIK